MVAAAKFETAGFGVRFAVGKSFPHQVLFVQLVQQHKTPFLLHNVIVDPDLALWNEFVYVIMTAGREVDVKHTSHQSAIHNPYLSAILQLLPQAHMHRGGIRQFFPAMRHLAEVPGTASFPAFVKIGPGERVVIRCALRHKRVLQQQMFDKKSVLIAGGFFVDPEFILRYVGVPVVLAEVCKLLIHVSANIDPIDYPYLVVFACFGFYKVWRLKHFSQIYEASKGVKFPIIVSVGVCGYWEGGFSLALIIFDT